MDPGVPRNCSCMHEIGEAAALCYYGIAFLLISLLFTFYIWLYGGPLIILMDGAHMRGNTCGFTLFCMDGIPRDTVKDPKCMDVNVFFGKVMATHSANSVIHSCAVIVYKRWRRSLSMFFPLIQD